MLHLGGRPTLISAEFDGFNTRSIDILLSSPGPFHIARNQFMSSRHIMVHFESFEGRIKFSRYIFTASTMLELGIYDAFLDLALVLKKALSIALKQGMVKICTV